MPAEPAEKRVFAFVDGQNLFHTAKEAFDYTFPNYDALELAKLVVRTRPDWVLSRVYFYTGVHERHDNAHWHDFWAAKFAVMGTRGVELFRRPLRKSTENGIDVFREKGIDVRLALDVVRLARLDEFDVALIFSQDQDLSEAADEVRAISHERDRWIKIASAFPLSDRTRNRRGIDKTDWIPIDKSMYDACIDPLDYRSR